MRASTIRSRFGIGVVNRFLLAALRAYVRFLEIDGSVSGTACGLQELDFEVWPRFLDLVAGMNPAPVAAPSPPSAAGVKESPRSMAASVLAGLVEDKAPAVAESVGPGPFRRRKGASMHKKSSPSKGAALPYGQPVRLHLDTPAPRPS